MKIRKIGLSILASSFMFAHIQAHPLSFQTFKSIVNLSTPTEKIKVFQKINFKTATFIGGCVLLGLVAKWTYDKFWRPKNPYAKPIDINIGILDAISKGLKKTNSRAQVIIGQAEGQETVVDNAIQHLEEIKNELLIVNVNLESLLEQGLTLKTIASQFNKEQHLIADSIKHILGRKEKKEGQLNNNLVTIQQLQQKIQQNLPEAKRNFEEISENQATFQNNFQHNLILLNETAQNYSQNIDAFGKKVDNFYDKINQTPTSNPQKIASLAAAAQIIKQSTNVVDMARRTISNK